MLTVANDCNVDTKLWFFGVIQNQVIKVWNQLGPTDTVEDERKWSMVTMQGSLGDVLGGVVNNL
jgi:hypothetical protein